MLYGGKGGAVALSVNTKQLARDSALGIGAQHDLHR